MSEPRYYAAGCTCGSCTYVRERDGIIDSADDVALEIEGEGEQREQEGASCV